jgi:Mn-dependent DtxR family transcriptional regulator
LRDFGNSEASALVEKIRNLSEFLIYAEKYGESYFE